MERSSITTDELARRLPIQCRVIGATPPGSYNQNELFSSFVSLVFSHRWVQPIASEFNIENKRFCPAIPRGKRQPFLSRFTESDHAFWNKSEAAVTRGVDCSRCNSLSAVLREHPKSQDANWTHDAMRWITLQICRDTVLRQREPDNHITIFDEEAFPMDWKWRRIPEIKRGTADRRGHKVTRPTIGCIINVYNCST
jgi:hypothetical protein